MLALTIFTEPTFDDVVDGLAVQTQPRSLLELLLAAVDIAGIGEVLVVYIHVFGQILLLSEQPAALVAFEFFLLAMDRQEVSFKAESGRKFFVAILDGADECLRSGLRLVFDHPLVQRDVLAFDVFVSFLVVLVFHFTFV